MYTYNAVYHDKKYTLGEMCQLINTFQNHKVQIIFIQNEELRYNDEYDYIGSNEKYLIQDKMIGLQNGIKQTFYNIREELYIWEK